MILGFFYKFQVLKMFNIKNKEVYNVLNFYLKNEKITKYEWIIYYDGINHYNNPVFVAKRTLKTILLAKEGHEKRNDRRTF